MALGDEAKDGTFTCPNCGQKGVKIPDICKTNVSTYGRTVIVTMPCCGKAVMLGIQQSFWIYKYTGGAKEDDWGTKIKEGPTMKCHIDVNERKDMFTSEQAHSIFLGIVAAHISRLPGMLRMYKKDFFEFYELFTAYVGYDPLA